MCFSASVSFAASGLLIATGVATLQQAKKKKEWLLASIPLFFALHQLIEGFLWITVPESAWHRFLVYGFLFFAFLWWPVYMPMSALLIETEPQRKKILKGFLALGIFVSVALLYFLMSLTITAEITDNSLRYFLEVPFPKVWTMLYLMAVCGSLMCSRWKWVRILGIAILFSFLASLQIYSATFISVWCFFAAILSALIYLHFRKNTTSF